MKRKVIALLSALTLLVVMFTGCSAEKQKISSADELNSAEFKVGTVQGPASMYITEEKFPKAKIKYYQNSSDCCTVLASEQLDAMVFSRCILENYAETDEKIALIDGNVDYANICAGLKLGNTELKAKVDEFIAQAKDDYAYLFPKGSEYVGKFNSALKELHESGKLAELEDYWINNPVENPVVDPQKSTGKNGTVKVSALVDNSL